MRATRRLSRLPGTPSPGLVIETDHGIALAADEWGPASGHPVLLLHGGGQTRHAWRGLGEELGRHGYRSLAFDLRGHGDSSWAADHDYSYDAHHADLLALMSACSIEAPALVGASLGGAISLSAVGEGAIDATALVLVDTAPQLETTGVDELRAFMTGRPEGYATLDEAADAIAEYTGRPRPTSTDGLSKNLRVDPNGRYHWHWDPGFLGAGDSHDPEHRRRRLEAAATSVDVATLLVRGARSTLLSEEGARGFLELCPHSEYVNIAGASHMVTGERNDRFARAVEEFLDRRAPSSTRIHATTDDRGGR